MRLEVVGMDWDRSGDPAKGLWAEMSCCILRYFICMVRLRSGAAARAVPIEQGARRRRACGRVPYTWVRPASPKRSARSCHVDSFIERTFRALEIFACTCLRLIDSGSGGMGFYAAQFVGVGAVTRRDSDETASHISYRDCRVSYTSCRGSHAQLVRDRLRMALFYPFCRLRLLARRAEGPMNGHWNADGEWDGRS